MGCNNSKNLEETWQSSDKERSSLIVDISQNKLKDIGAPLLDKENYIIKHFLQQGG